MIYNSLVLPHLNYCNYIWGNTYKSHLMKLYIFQKRAIRIITKSHVHSPSKPLFKKLKALPIFDLITFNTLFFMYSVQVKALPETYCNMFTVNSNVHPYFTRQQNHFHRPKVKSTSASQSLYHVGIKIWNNLPLYIKTSSTSTRFKKLCKQFLLESL